VAVDIPDVNDPSRHPTALHHGLAACLLFLGLGSATAALAAFARGEERAFGSVAALIEPFRQSVTALWPALPPAAPKGWTALLHWDPACPCSARAARALEGLFGALPGQERLLVVVPQGSLRLAATRRFAGYAPVVLEPGNVPTPPASPALALFDASGVLRYLGPLASGPGCGQVPPHGVLPPMLAALLEGKGTLLTPTAVRGCFCTWTEVVADPPTLAAAD